MVVDMEAIARDAERQPEPPIPEPMGPIKIEDGRVIDTATGKTLIEPAGPPEPERSLDVTLVAFGFQLAAVVAAIIAAVIAPGLSASQHIGIVALVLMVAGERLWLEIHRAPRPVAPEGVMYGQHQEQSTGY